MKNTSICRVSPRELAKALHMPEGTMIDNAQWDMHDDSLWLRVSHPSIPAVPEGCPPMPVTLLITEHVNVDDPHRVARTYTGEWK